METDDAYTPRVTGRVTTSEGRLGAGPVRRSSVPLESPVAAARPMPHEAPTTVQVATPEAPDPDLPALSAATEISRTSRGFAERHRLMLASVWLAVVAGGVVALVLALLDTGSAYLDEVGATVVLTAYTWALAARTGGRPIVFAAVALLASVGVLISEQAYLRTGAAVMTCCIAAVLALVATVPALTYLRAVRESLVAVLIASVGALATLGFAPTVSLVRFEYATLALSLIGAFIVVYRLGAGLHGLGRRGVVVVAVGGGVLVMTLLYAEALRQWGPPELVDGLLDAVRWCRDHLGAFPRPIVAVLGIPALAWGVHMRARRRQGWWVCAFGVAGTAAVANSLLNPAITLRECGLSVLFGLLVGLAIGWVVIRAEVALSSGSGSRGPRGGRRSDERAAARPEPPRTASLI